MSRIVALGAGRMGRGIAQVCASAGFEIAIVDFKQRESAAAGALLQTAAGEIEDNLRLLARLGVLEAAAIADIMARVSYVSLDDCPDVVSQADFIFEGVPETMAAKQDALARLAELTGPETIVASTTSTILVDELAGHAGDPTRFLNAHWLNPAYLIPLVEVSPGKRTAERTVETTFELLRQLGKAPVRCQASPGYIIPRIQAVAMNEAARMVEEGVATAEDIDAAIRTGFGIRYATMGLVEFIDWGGVDILFHASNYLSEALDSERYETPDIVKRKMAAGELGLGNGKGFYDFTVRDTEAYKMEKLATFVALLEHLGLSPRIAG